MEIIIYCVRLSFYLENPISDVDVFLLRNLTQVRQLVK